MVSERPLNRTRPSAAAEEEEWEYWSLKDSVLFCFTVITTIGYGNVAPQTMNGQLFVIFYGLVGVPCTMLVIANLGKFLAELLRAANRRLYRCCRSVHRLLLSNSALRLRDRVLCFVFAPFPLPECILAEFIPCGVGRDFRRLLCCRSPAKQALLSKLDENDNEAGPADERGDSQQSGASGLFAAFLAYNLVGGLILSSYEPEMDFFKAIYFNFVTLTTIGLGDIVPQRLVHVHVHVHVGFSGEYLFLTLAYVALGLALTSIAIEIAADYLKRLHYFGRKIDNVAQVTIWFGAQKLTMKQLVRNLGDQFNLPTAEMEQLNLERFVDDAIKVEAGELATLRVSFSRASTDPRFRTRAPSGPSSSPTSRTRSDRVACSTWTRTRTRPRPCSAASRSWTRSCSRSWTRTSPSTRPRSPEPATCAQTPRPAPCLQCPNSLPIYLLLDVIKQP